MDVARRLRKTGDDEGADEIERLRTVLANLVRQIDMTYYRDLVGNPLKLNVHFSAARELVNPGPAKRPETKKTPASR